MSLAVRNIIIHAYLTKLSIQDVVTVLLINIVGMIVTANQ